MIKIEKNGSHKRLEIQGGAEELIRDWVEITQHLIKVLAKEAPEGLVKQTMKDAFRLAKAIGFKEAREEKQEEGR